VTKTDQTTMNLTGYTDRLSVRPGERIGFHVHTADGQFDSQMVRLRHGDENPKGPGFRESIVPSVIDGRHEGAARTINPGSCGIIEIAPPISAQSFTLALWVWPTLPRKGIQGLAAGFGANDQAWFELRLGEAGALEFLLNGAICATANRALDPREWYFVAVVVDVVASRARLHVHRRRYTWPAPVAFDQETEIGDRLGPNGESLSKLILAASACAPTKNSVPAARNVFNGKLAAPRIHARCLSKDEIVELASGQEPADVVAYWDFSRESGSVQLVDTGPNGWHGKTHNRPARLMVGPFWSGEMGPSERHDAIHFHNDDTADVGWPESVALTVPDDWQSGVYALRIRAAGEEDHLPFFVLSPRGKATNPIAVLFPTLSYLAYANECVDPAETAALNPLYDLSLRREELSYAEANGLKSTYDSHVDRSGICFSAVRRPNFDFRPRARSRIVAAPRQFPADLYLVDWLEQVGFDFDVISDFDLHNEGADLLRQYRVVLTGSHPEYWSGAMIEARDGYLQGGGRLMYLGGDGFYWSTAVTNDDGGLIEVRRFTGVRTWQAQPGEFWLSLTGAMGGIWRDHGKAPQKSVGVGFSGQGFDRGAAYRRTPQSYEALYASVFDGVSGEVFGDGQSLTLNFGAAGVEVDKADPDLGTPAHAVVLASSVGFSDSYQRVIEETLLNTPWSGGLTNPAVRSDIVLLECPRGGRVFSVGSIGWTATLSGDEYQSDTSRITLNVLRAFLQ
jgi:N,N-dimethylformamidase